MLCGSASKGRVRGALGVEPPTSRLRDGVTTTAPRERPSMPWKLGLCQAVGATSGSWGGEHGGGGILRSTGAVGAGAAAADAAAVADR